MLYGNGFMNIYFVDKFYPSVVYIYYRNLHVFISKNMQKYVECSLFVVMFVMYIDQSVSQFQYVFLMIIGQILTYLQNIEFLYQMFWYRGGGRSHTILYPPGWGGDGAQQPFKSAR